MFIESFNVFVHHRGKQCIEISIHAVDFNKDLKTGQNCTEHQYRQLTTYNYIFELD